MFPVNDWNGNGNFKLSSFFLFKKIGNCLGFRYKQYTRNDIMSAIEEVKNGMSALQASRKYGVPSRTLYDKVKKMGITTGRQVQRKSLPDYPSQFPGALGRVSLFKMFQRLFPISKARFTDDECKRLGGSWRYK